MSSSHLVLSDGRYQRRIAGEEVGPRHQGPPPPLATLRAQMERQAARWLELLDRLDELDCSMPAEPTVLGANGLDDLDLSAWEYVRVIRPEG